MKFKKAFLSVGIVAMLSLPPQALAETENASNVPNAVNAELDSSAETDDVLSDFELQRAKKFRSDFGLKADDAYIKSLEKTASFKEKKQKYGVSLTDAEFQDLQRRDEVIEDAKKVKADLIDKSYTDEFGGVYYSHDSNGGVLRIGVKKGDKGNSFKNELKKNFKHKNVEFFDVDYTEKELAAIKQQVSEYAKNQPSVSYVTTSVADNKVVVALKQADDTITKVLNEKFGSKPLQIKIDNYQAKNFVSAYGGDGITNNRDNCTIGYNGTKNGSAYVVTAGHCGPAGEMWSFMSYKNTFPYTRELGVSQTSFNGPWSDSMAIPIRAEYGTANYIGTFGYRPFTSVQALNSDILGEVVCANGKVSGNIRCGKLTNKDWDTGLFGTWQYNLRMASFVSQHGDSGGSIFAESGTLSTLKGVLKGGSSWDTAYTHIGYVIQDTGVTPRLNN
ncbi:hypothetical protein J2T17_006389 [Paenibacillus mucilaginosus]|uniref:S1 family peptidase n=1 Tax=Paenibacillus mucilaginosus TaxID=61624 RepID=UPI003D2266E4